MKEYITIKNFGPLKNINHLEIRPLTVLIGESAIGKSTLMKLVAMMRYLFKMTNIRSYLNHSNITRSPFKIRFDKMISSMGLTPMLEAESYLRYEVEMESGNHYELMVEDKKLKKLPLIEKEDLSFTKVSFISENRNVIPSWVEKASLNSGATLGFYFHETNEDFATASEDDKVMDLKYMNMRLYVSHPKGKPVRYRITSMDSNGNKAFELREASSGIQTSVPLAMIVNHFAHNFSFKDAFNRSVLNYLHDINRLTKFKPIADVSALNKKVYIHIEEPELSLFPDAQCKLIDELLYTATHPANDRDMSIMMATHSPYILNYLNIILNQDKEGRAHIEPNYMSVYRLYDGQSQNLLMQDENGKLIVDTYDLTEMMARIYQEFNE